MPACMHKGHKRDVVKDGNTKKTITDVKGYNPIYRRFEWCDEGFIQLKTRRTPKKRKDDDGGVQAR